MSRPMLNRPKTAAGLPLRCSTELVAISLSEQDAQDSEYLPTASSTLRLPTLSSSAPRFSRQPRLWTEAQGRQREVIGEGAFGCVFRATFKGRTVAVKEVGSRMSFSRRRQPVVGDSPDDHGYRREVRGAGFLLDLRHENVVQYLHFDTTSVPGVLYVVMELIQGSNLTELRRKGPISLGDMRSVIAQTCCGLHYLHSHKPPIVHRDVKGSNIMLTNGHRVVKLVDLGLAILTCDECDKDENGNNKDQTTTGRSLAGTYRFMAPEVYECQSYSASSDVFALGCATFELQCGHPPHQDKTNEMAVCYAVMMQPMPDMPEACDLRLTDLYKRCTRKNPTMRPTAAQILEHSFITGAPTAATLLRS